MTINQLRRSLALNGLQFRKDIELLRCDFRFTASHCEAQRLCSPFPEMQSSRIVPLASAPAGCAAPYSTTHDHCGTLKGFSRNISKAALNLAPSVARASPLGDCACPRLPHRLRVVFRNVIICVVLTVLSAVPIPRSYSQSRTPRCEYADHHELELTAKSSPRHA